MQQLTSDLFSEAIEAQPRQRPREANSLASASDPGTDDEHSALLLRPKPVGPASAPFPLTRRLA